MRQKETTRWAECLLRHYFSTKAASQPRTAGDLLAILDAHPSAPAAWYRRYQDRYTDVNNILKHFAYTGQVERGSTENARGKLATTYFRRRLVAVT